MGSPSMDRYAGHQQAELDLMRGDMFALINHRYLVLDWNVDKDSWIAGYGDALFEAASNFGSPETAQMALTALDLSTAPLPQGT